MKTLLYPTMAELEASFLSADKDFNDADGTKLAEYQTSFLVKNSRLRGHVNTRRTAVASWDWDLVPFDSKDIEIAAEAKRRLSKIINKIIPGRVNTALFGFFAADIEFLLAETGNERIPVLRAKHKPSNVVAISDNSIKVKNGDKIITKNLQTLTAKGGNINPVVTLIETDGEDFRGGQLLSISISEILRLDMLAEWSNWAKKQKGMIQGIDKGADEQERGEAESAMKNLLKHNYVFTSDFIEYQFHQIANSTAGSSFKDMINELNNAISIAILGQANTSELPKSGGSYAALEVQRKVSADIMYTDAIATKELIDNQLLPIDFFFSKNSTEVPYEFKVILAEQVDYESNAAVLREALSAGVPLKKSEVYEKIGYTQPGDGDELFEGGLA